MTDLHASHFPTDMKPTANRPSYSGHARPGSDPVGPNPASPVLSCQPNRRLGAHLFQNFLLP
jgi:hypothetical protein